MPRRSNLSRDRVDADRIGRMGGRRTGERSVNAELAKRLAGFKGRPRGRSRDSGGARQRVVVKALVSRHTPGKARGSIMRHASYLGRESASADGRPGVFYDAARDGVNARQEVAGWAQDRHHFRLIVSPEHGNDIPDMTAYVREAMRRVGRDLDAGKLEWVAVNHHNTDNPHAHVMVRGRREDGTDLVIPRRYISYGIRDRASEVATELLGQRSAQEVRSAKAKEVEAERFTSLDRMIERHLVDGRIDVAPSRHIGFGPDDRRLVVGRLQFLQGLELAHKGRGTQWQIDPTFKQALHDLGARNDIIKQLYASLGAEAGRVQRMTGDAAATAPVVGVVIALGSTDEIGPDRFVVVRDAAGQPHYGRVRDGEAYRDLAIGSVAELGGGASRRQRVTEQVLAVAKANENTYSGERHDAILRAVEPGLTDWQVASLVRSATGRLHFVSGVEGAGVRSTEGGQFAVEPDAFERFSRHKGERTDVRAIALHTLEQQVGARAVTWLDRQAFGDAPDARFRDHPAVADAIGRRREWLVQQGYAARSEPAGTDVAMRPNALRELAAAERSEVIDRLADKYNRPVSGSSVGSAVEGTYRGTERLHGGRLAVVVNDDRVSIVPVDKEADVSRGSTVRVRRTSRKSGAVEAIVGHSVDRSTGVAIEQMEAGR